MLVVMPERGPRNAQFDIQRRDGEIREGLLYYNEIWGLYTVCRLLIRTQPEKAAVMITELPESPGVTPVKRIVELLAIYIHNELIRHLVPGQITWAVCHRSRLLSWLGRGASYSVVTFRHRREDGGHRYDRPSWRASRCDEIAALFGEARFARRG